MSNVTPRGMTPSICRWSERAREQEKWRERSVAELSICIYMNLLDLYNIRQVIQSERVCEMRRSKDCLTLQVCLSQFSMISRRSDRVRERIEWRDPSVAEP